MKTNYPAKKSECYESICILNYVTSCIKKFKCIPGALVVWTEHITKHMKLDGYTSLNALGESFRDKNEQSKMFNLKTGRFHFVLVAK